jgi:hypothetical protein
LLGEWALQNDPILGEEISPEVWHSACYLFDALVEGRLFPRLLSMLHFPLEGVVLLESALDQSIGNHPDGGLPPDWESYLNERASAHPLFRRRQISLLGGRGRVVLTGTVASFYEKQLAQELVRHCDGVEQIDNRLEVTYDD